MNRIEIAIKEFDLFYIPMSYWWNKTSERKKSVRLKIPLGI